MVSFVQFVLLHHNLVNISKGENVLCGLAGWGLLVLIEPLLLARFGTTAGKWCMGITVTRPDGERLSYGEALERTAAVWLYGAGLGISIVELCVQLPQLPPLYERRGAGVGERQHRALRRARHEEDGAALRGEAPH